MADPTPITSPGWFAITASASFLTASLSIAITDYFARKRDREAAASAHAREREARQAAKREQRFERRASFQRQTLIDLQEAVMKAIRTSGEMHHCDVMAARAGHPWHAQLYPGDLSERDRLAGVQLNLLGVRVRDALVRELVVQLRDTFTSIVLSRSQAQGDAAVMQMADIFQKLNGRIGELLRKLDDDEDAEAAGLLRPGG